MKYIFKKIYSWLLYFSSLSKNILVHGTKLLIYWFKNNWLMGEYEKNKYFSKSNQGLSLDWYKYRLSLKDSFNHLSLVSRTWGWKTTSFVIPNILALANGENSMIITDISWEIFDKTSWYLAQKGYNIKVLNPENLDESIRYNPLLYATDSVQIDELATILIESSKWWNNWSNEFWNNWAKSIISIFIKVLKEIDDFKYMNLANVRYLINNYWEDWEKLKKLINKFADEKTKQEFEGFRSWNSSTILSIIANANIALAPIWINDNLEKLTSNYTLNFDIFRREKTILYIKIPANKQKQYSFLQNIFYHQFFSYMQEKLPSEKDLPIFCILDEFWNLSLPSFETTITTIRKYKVSISIILQHIKQLENKYWKANAETILNGWIASKLFFSWADLETTQMLSKMLWKDEEEKQIMRAEHIRTLKDSEALFIMSNKLPLKLKIKPYYKNKKLNGYTKATAYRVKKTKFCNKIEYLKL